MLSGLAPRSVSSASNDEFPNERHPGTIASGPNFNAFLTFPLLTSRQGEKIYLKQIPWTGSQKARRMCTNSLKGSMTGNRIVRSIHMIQTFLAVADASCGILGTTCGLPGPLYAPEESKAYSM